MKVREIVRERLYEVARTYCGTNLLNSRYQVGLSNTCDVSSNLKVS